MQLKCVSQSDELDTMMQNVSQSVEMVYSIAVAKLEHAASFRTSRDYVDTYTKQMLPYPDAVCTEHKGSTHSVYPL